MTDFKPHRIGLVLVHGIGEHEPGDSSKKFIKALRLGDPSGHLVIGQRRGSQRIIVECRETNRELWLYEAHWADLLKPVTTGSFNARMLANHCWFPRFNKQLRGSTQRPCQTGIRDRFWTVALIPIGGLLLLVHLAFESLLSPGSETSRKYSPRSLWHNWKRMRTSPPNFPTSRFTKKLDEYLGDIFTYVQSLGESAPKGNSSLRPELSKEIIGRFRSTLNDALKDKCDEIQILAHSLGSVIAFHGLHGYGVDAAVERTVMDKVKCVFIIGSPLNKITFFWPKLILNTPGTCRQASSCSPRWENFYSPLDFVSGKLEKTLTHLDVHSNRIVSAGPIRAHVSYEHNRQFLGAITESVFKKKLEPPFNIGSWIKGIVAAIWDAVILVLGFATSVCLGLAYGALFLVLMGGIFALVGLLLTWFLNWIGWGTASEYVKLALAALGILVVLSFTVLLLRMWYDEAIKAHRLFNHEDELSRLRQATKKQPNNAVAHNELGFFLSSLGWNQQALAAFEEAIHINPNNAVSHTLRGDMLRKNNPPDLDTALKEYNKAIELQPNNPDPFWGRALVHRMREQPREALEAYLKVRELSGGKDKSLSYNISASLHTLGQDEQALQELESAIKADRRGATFAMHYLRGNILLRLGQYEQAIVAYETCTNIRPDYSILGLKEARQSSGTPNPQSDLDAVFTHLAEALYNADRPEQALEALSEAIAIDDQNPESHRLCGQIQFQLGNYEKALHSFSVVTDLYNDGPLGHFWRGLSLIELERSREALRAFDKFVDLRPNDAAGHCGRCISLSTPAQEEEAANAFRLAVRSGRKDVESAIDHKLLQLLKLETLESLMKRNLLSAELWEWVQDQHYFKSLRLDPGSNEKLISLLKEHRLASDQ